jgi:hypothetical protein
LVAVTRAWFERGDCWWHRCLQLMVFLWLPWLCLTNLR